MHVRDAKFAFHSAKKTQFVSLTSQMRVAIIRCFSLITVSVLVALHDAGAPASTFFDTCDHDGHNLANGDLFEYQS